MEGMERGERVDPPDVSGGNVLLSDGGWETFDLFSTSSNRGRSLGTCSRRVSFASSSLPLYVSSYRIINYY